MKYRNLILLIILIAIITTLWIINWRKSQYEKRLFKNEKNIRIGADQCFSLTDDEFVMDLKSKDSADSIYINKNIWYLYNRETDQVLNQVIKGKNNFFIWLSALTPGEFARKQNADSTLVKIKNHDFNQKERKYYTFFMKRKDMFIARTLFVANTGELIIIDNTGPDSLAVSNKYSDTAFITQRLNCSDF